MLVHLIIKGLSKYFKKIYLSNYSNRRDFRLLIGDPSHPGKSVVNPVIWLNTDVVTEVIFRCFHFL